LFHEVFLVRGLRRFEMKKIILVVCVVALMAFSGSTIVSAQPAGPGYGYGMGPGMMGPGYGYGYGMGPGMMGPGYGYGMGPGMMGPGYGYGMGPGMMGPGYGYGYGMGPGMMGRGYGGYGMVGPGYGYGPQYGYGQQYQQPQKPLDKDQAKQEVENYVKSTRNPNLSVGNIEEKGNDFEADIQTKNGSLVDKVLVDKDTGSMRSAY
jgi:hypothetical protein